ncbi:MAG: prolyl oligopeptidase family serine peptidase [Pseudohongiella sp.]|nr:prolyl oligopeptidase family serine peptidase [Pseudohongiella sp.]
MKNSLFAALILFLTWVFAAATFAQETYRMPPPEVAALVDAPSMPGLVLSPDRSLMLLLHSPGVPTIADLAQPELRLGGTRINPRDNGPSRANYTRRITVKNPADLSERDVTGLPENPVIRNVVFAPDGRHIAFVVSQATHTELWLADLATTSARRLGDILVNNTWGGAPFEWLPDSTALLVRSVPATRGNAPQAPLAPLGPVIQESTGEAAPARTYQDLLGNPYDEALFDYYFTSQLLLVELDGVARPIGIASVFNQSSVSPDGNYLLISRLQKPYSYTVPASRFPTVTEVWDFQGQVITEVESLPLLDNIPIAVNSTYEGKRNITWRADVPATLFWVETQDGGVPTTEVSVRDIAYLQDAPFTAAPRQIAGLATRFAGITWGHGELAMISETWRANRTTRTWRVSPDNNNPWASATLMFERNYEDEYSNPGSPVMQINSFGRPVIQTAPEGNEIFLTGLGASNEGNRPFLSALNPDSGQIREIWRSEAPYFESVVAVSSPDATRFITRRESKTEPPNFVEWNLANNSDRSLTAFPHPTPELVDVQSEFVTYPRADGLPLSAQLLLPPGYNTQTDGPLPLVLWAYPREFASADSAGQLTDSPYRFNAISYWGPHFLVTQGYAVLNNAAMPIVAPAPDIEPNESFIEQLVSNARAAIDYLAERGIADRDRVAVGGHSYGAFMTANLLAHSDLFKAGIARSGAYNRSLTPFGFQAEPRNIWEAQDTYITMSPFFFAHQIKAPILFIHGEADNNTGTFPIQSERMYQAVRGVGGPTRLVMLPHESHGYQARESLMHMLWETIEWLDTYVK